MPISCPPTPCQQVAFPSRSTQPLSFQPAQSTGPAKPRKTSQCAPLHPSVDLMLLSSHPNWEKPFTFPILFQSGAAVSMATFRPPPLHLPLPKLGRGSYCLSVGLTKTAPLHYQGWTGVPNQPLASPRGVFLPPAPDAQRRSPLAVAASPAHTRPRAAGGSSAALRPPPRGSRASRASRGVLPRAGAAER